jgi:hypothetical protein
MQFLSMYNFVSILFSTKCTKQNTENTPTGSGAYGWLFAVLLTDKSKVKVYVSWSKYHVTTHSNEIIQIYTVGKSMK